MWRDDAACKGWDTARFFPDDGTNIDPEIRNLCAHCPVRQECLNHAIDTPEKYGVWAGLAPKQRRHYRSLPKVRRCPECDSQFVSVNFTQVTCSPACRVVRQRRQQRERKRDRLAQRRNQQAYRERKKAAAQ